MTAVVATSAPEIAITTVRNASGKPQQRQSSAQRSNDSVSGKDVNEPGAAKSGVKRVGPEDTEKLGCAGWSDCEFEGDGNQSFDDAINIMDGIASKQLEQRDAATLPPVAAQGVFATSGPKSDDASNKPDATATAAVTKGRGALLARADWLAMDKLAAGSNVESAVATESGNVPSDDLAVTVFDPIRGLKLETATTPGDRGADAAMAKAPVEPRVRVNVVAQEAHWNFGSSPQRMSSRTAETLVVAGSGLAPSRLQARGDSAVGLADVDLPAQVPAPAVPSDQPGMRAGHFTAESGAEQPDSGGNRQTGAKGATDFAQQLRRATAVKPDSTATIAPAGFGAEAVRPPAQQVTDAIVNASQNEVGTTAAANAASPNGVLRRLDIKLDPANLGEIQVKLSLNANALSIDISTANIETAKMLSQDRQHIDAGLRRAGYDLVDYSVSIATNDATAAAVTAASAAGDARPSLGQNAGGSAASQQSSLPNGSLGGSNDRGAGRNDFSQQPRQPFAEHASSGASPALPPQGGIYV